MYTTVPSAATKNGKPILASAEECRRRSYIVAQLTNTDRKKIQTCSPTFGKEYDF